VSAFFKSFIKLLFLSSKVNGDESTVVKNVIKKRTLKIFMLTQQRSSAK
jgi:hypothetical protein